MNTLRQIAGNMWLVTALRLALGAVFLISAITKLQSQALFVDTVIRYDLLPVGLAEVYGHALPWVEFVVGVALVLGVFTRAAAGLSALMAVSFIIGGIYSLYRPNVELCGCFGDLLALTHAQAIAVDVAMLGTAALLIWQRHKAEIAGIGFLFRRNPIDTKAGMRTVLAALALCLVVVISAPFATGAGGQVLPDPEDGKPEFILFWDGCDTCPFDWDTWERLEAEYLDRIHFREVNYLEQKDLAAVFEVDTKYYTTVLVTGRGTDQMEIHQRWGGNLDMDWAREVFDDLLDQLE